jgi:hypothetical protein
MLIQLNTNEGVEGGRGMERRVEAEIADALEHFEDQITRVEVYLKDANADKHGATDKICVIEARPAGRDAIATTHKADNLDDALTGAATKMQHRLAHELGRAHGHKGGETTRHMIDPED